MSTISPNITDAAAAATVRQYVDQLRRGLTGKNSKLR